MANVLVIRCTNGVVTWGMVGALKPNGRKWVCGQDGYVIAAAESVADAQRVLLAIAAHSVAIAGTVQQVAQLEV